MATTTVKHLMIDREIDSYSIQYASLDLGSGKLTGTKSSAYILCRDSNARLAGIIKFYEQQPPPVNSYRGSEPNYVLHINYHISRFNDIINILRYHKPLSLVFDLGALDGALEQSEFEPVGLEQQNK